MVFAENYENSFLYTIDEKNTPKLVNSSTTKMYPNLLERKL